MLAILLLLYSHTMATKVSFNYFPIRVISECSFSHRLDHPCHLMSLYLMQIQSFWTINSAYLNGACVTKWRNMRCRLRLPRTVASSSEFTFLSLSASHQGHQIVVISRKKAADTGSLLTHFICLALGLLSMKQMERNCIISRAERLLAGYLNMLPGVSAPPPWGAFDSILEAWPPWRVI